MGVPRLSIWLKKNFPAFFKTFSKDDPIGVRIDNLYIDGNAILHGATQHVYNYGEHKRLVDPLEGMSMEFKQTKVFEVFFNKIRELVTIARPKKMLYISIDGVAPHCKLVQQRQRRYIASKSVSERGGFDSNVITCGTQFMLELTKYMNTAIRKEMNNYIDWRDLTVYFSPPTVPGEGEHKLLQYIRLVKDPNLVHCLCGPDGDLFFLCLASYAPRMLLLREDQYNFGMIELFNMGGVREALPGRLGAIGSLSKKSDRPLNDIINDFIMLGFFVGNDFLPKVQMFLLLEHGMELMIQIYSEILAKKSNEAFIIRDGEIDIPSFAMFVTEIAKREPQYLMDQLSYPVEDPKLSNNTLKKFVKTDLTGATTLFGDHRTIDFEGYREAYYERIGIDEADITNLCEEFLKGMRFVFEYYTKGIPSWRWYYPYQYPPLMVDFAKYLTKLGDASRKINVADNTVPLLPFVQLVCVLPPPSRTLLPTPLRSLFFNPSLKEFYPDKVDIDYEGKYKLHEGVVLLPFINVEKVIREYNKIKLKVEYVRNKRGKINVFRFDPTMNADFVSDYGKIEDLKIRKIEIEPHETYGKKSAGGPRPPKSRSPRREEKEVIVPKSPPKKDTEVEEKKGPSKDLTKFVDTIFPRFNLRGKPVIANLRENVNFTNETLWYMTPFSHSQYITRIMEDLGMEHVVDGTSGIGGNVISFALSRKIQTVLAFEREKDRFGMLRENINLYGVKEKVRSENREVPFDISVAKNTGLFLDPPWGGHDIISSGIKVSGHTLEEWVNLVCAKTDKGRGVGKYKLVVLKLPPNYKMDFGEIDECVEVKIDDTRKKMRLVIARVKSE